LRILVAGERSSSAGAQLQGIGYCTRFRVLPWAMAFRPSLKPPRPSVTGDFGATVQHRDACPCLHGYRALRFDWQVQAPADDPV
ncbi:type VI secretion system tip protein VgrG, partial [Pseudomonas syringae pv. tagetis]